jgi:hypothetical protein
MDYYSIADTVLIDKSPIKGIYVVNDTLLLSVGLEPFDSNVCDTFDLAYNPINRKEYPCTLADLSPPFHIYKGSISDTLVVIKNKRVILFRIPKNEEWP